MLFKHPLVWTVTVIRAIESPGTSETHSILSLLLLVDGQVIFEWAFTEKRLLFKMGGRAGTESPPHNTAYPIKCIHTYVHTHTCKLTHTAMHVHVPRLKARKQNPRVPESKRKLELWRHQKPGAPRIAGPMSRAGSGLSLCHGESRDSGPVEEIAEVMKGINYTPGSTENRTTSKER